MIKVEYKHTEIAVKKKLGQNFLTDRNITRKIVTESGVKSDDNILEIGPGFGALTQEITTIAPRFTVVEKDPKLAAFIRNEYPDLTVIEGDFLTVDLKKIASAKPLRILGNIPYAITSPILFKLLENRHDLLSATLMMQHEVALRITAKPRSKDYGILAVQMQAFCDIKYLFRVGRKVFRPQPGVDSGVISMTPKVSDPVSDQEGFSRFVRCAFHQRRKTLQNNLKKSYELNLVESSVLKQRAEELSIEDFFHLFGQLKPLSASSSDMEN
ncbi:MAG: 16S rRNA (adenine(1518)-N(6)/adenine(1519)-N(6))-dimethyltransferase RsmA [Chlorobiaceae bacterium]|jgi:16S rRNA (adenine1518-N6/adenine1519-N6)-dimethyltransferase|nr:16S rRNA (adenine(1518)-N(6)/adenine(1519)-N(6))-dimethyltransferase RsmA [Chlorobiaceae bacterium]NTW63767.1 16S rRNA (adenine(1518)-N(6)/adenine(1519)-N(6))-dimethyltransferase RsmA [Chlorobiaceae bacterium]